MSLRPAIAAVEQTLQTAGYTRSKENFTLDRLPASTAHRSYTLGRLELRPRYYSSGIADYLDARLPLLIAFRVHGPHNPSGSYAEAYLQTLDAYQQIENALVAGLLSSNGQNNTVDSAVLQPFFDPANQEYLLLAVNLNLDILRPMT